jgi:hypothetical protein
MNFGRAFSYVTEDPQWLQKVGIAALIMIIPILGQIVVLGWALEITRHIINGEPETPLPEWSNFGDYLSKGFQAFVIGVVYALPVILVQICSQGVSYLPTMMRDNSNVQAIASAASVVAICLSCLVFLYDLVLAFVLPAALGSFAATGQIGAGFRFNEIIGLVRAAPGPYFMVFLGSIVAGIIATLGLIACIIGVLFTAAYSYTIQANLWGQAYKLAKANTGMPAAPAAPAM